MADDAPDGAIDLNDVGQIAKAITPTDTSAVSPFESFWRGAAEGATFGFDDELGLSAARREQSRKDNPWTHFGGELVGGIAPVVATGGLGAGIRGGAVAARAAGLIPTSGARAGLAAARGLEAALLPGEITGVGSAALQGAKLGATYGGLSGAGHADVTEDDTTLDALGKRALGTAKGAAVGSVVGAPLGLVAHGVGRAAQGVLSARAAANAETQDAPSGALQAISRAFERDRITPDDIVAQIRRELPDDTATAGGRRYWGNRQPWTADQVEGVVRRAINGESAADISKAMRAGGAGPGPRAVQTLLDEMESRYIAPLNLVDRAAMIRTGSGDNTQMTLRAAAATPGQGRSIARENLLERQIGAGGRLQQAFERLVGSSDFEGVAHRNAEALRTAGGQAYKAAEAAEQPFNLTPILNQWDQKYAPMRGPVPDGIKAALDDLKTTAQGPLTGYVKTSWAPQNLEGYINARQNLQQRIDSEKMGTPLRRALLDLKRAMDTEVRTTNPLWGVANDIWRDGKAAEDALQAGARMATRLNTRTREALSEYTDGQTLARLGQRNLAKATTAQEQAEAQAQINAGQARMDLFKVGLVRALNDMLANKPETHELTRIMRLPAARQIMREVLGDADSAALYRIVDAEHAIHRTYSSQFGSQTTPLKEAVDDLNWAPRLRSSWELLNPRVALAEAGTWLASRYAANRNQAMMPLLTEDNPVRQLDTLRALQQITKARDVGDQTVRRPAMAGVGDAANVTAGEMLPKPMTESRLLGQARNALRRGADRKAIEDRLRSLGVDPGNL